MKVYEMIKQLEKFDPMLEVVVNSEEERPEGFENHFMLIPIESVEEIENEVGDKMIMLEGKMYDISSN